MAKITGDTFPLETMFSMMGTMLPLVPSDTRRYHQWSRQHYSHADTGIAEKSSFRPHHKDGKVLGAKEGKGYCVEEEPQKLETEKEISQMPRLFCARKQHVP